jgi:hypothetical protein
MSTCEFRDAQVATVVADLTAERDRLSAGVLAIARALGMADGDATPEVLTGAALAAVAELTVSEQRLRDLRLVLAAERIATTLEHQEATQRWHPGPQPAPVPPGVDRVPYVPPYGPVAALCGVLPVDSTVATDDYIPL